MNFNLKEISTEEAEALPSGEELWAGQTRETAVKGEKVSTYGWQIEGRAFEIHHNLLLRRFGFKLYIPTPDAVDISPSEAAARMVDGLPVEFRNPANGNPDWIKPDVARLSWIGPGVAACQWRIPACPAAKPEFQELTIRVPKGVEVPDAFEFGVVVDVPIEGRTATYSRSVTATVIHREAK